MTDIRAIEPGKYNKLLAEAIKKIPEFKKPEWVDFVKTGAQKSRPNVEEDFWQKRAASILRQLYIHGIVGVQRLRSRYGGRKDRGMRPPEFVRAGGKIIRVLLQQSDSAGLTEKIKGKKAGRQLTKNGRELLESIK
jgi:small subunit ribosomal protein S19e